MWLVNNGGGGEREPDQTWTVEPERSHARGMLLRCLIEVVISNDVIIHRYHFEGIMSDPIEGVQVTTTKLTRTAYNYWHLHINIYVRVYILYNIYTHTLT
jgi:hypothetical protein